MRVLLIAIVGVAAIRAQDPSCGDPPVQPDASKGPAVLIVGDSISMGCCWDHVSGEPIGYGFYVRDMLANHTLGDVQHCGGWQLGGQAGPTPHQLQCAAQWVGKYKFDVITYNSGLHDLANDSEHVPLDQYAANVVMVAKQFL